MNAQRNNPPPDDGLQDDLLTPAFPLEGRTKELWDKVLDALAPLGILRSCDSFALTRYATLLARWERLAQFLREHGDTYQGKGGLTKLYPQSTIALQLAASLLALEQQFGMTPLSRTRLPVAKRKDDDGWKARLFKPRVDNPA